MDALKGCTSNVHVLKDIDTMRYRLYVCEQSSSSCARQISRAVADLRDKHVVCSASGNRIWIFSDAEEEIIERDLVDFRQDSQGVFADHIGTTSAYAGEQSLASKFLDALEGSITFALSRAYSALRVSAWTWVLSGTELRNSGTEVHMSVHLADDRRKLSIATTLRRTHLIRLPSTNCHDHSEVLMSPSGIVAEECDEEIGTGENNIIALVNDQWKASVRDALVAEGIDLPADAVWICLMPAQTQTTVLWPMSLCLLLDNDGGAHNPGSLHADDWRGWFDLPGIDTYNDPLSCVEEWITTFAEKEEQHQIYESTGKEDLVMNDNTSTQAHIDNIAFDVSSPPLTNRADLQALHGIYPTPPDGLVAHGVNQLQPQPESMSATSGDMAHVPAFTPSDPAPENNMSLFEAGPEMERDPMQRNHSIASSTGPQAQDWNRGSTDDLFGDMDDMEYGREEVGDADFNFFDEPDAQPVKGTMELYYDSAAGHVPDPDHGQQDMVPPEIIETSNVETSAGVTADRIAMQIDDADRAASDPPGGNHVAIHSSSPNDIETSLSDLPRLQHQQSDDVKPLSPFGIKEALLPPPIPASASQNHDIDVGERRRSSFGPLAFNIGGSFLPKTTSRDYSDFRPDKKKSSVDFGPTKVPLAAISESSPSIGTQSSLDGAESDSEAETNVENDSLSTTSAIHHVAGAGPEEGSSLVMRKRKRSLDTFSYCGPQPTITCQDSQVHHSALYDASDVSTDDKVQILISRLLGTDKSFEASQRSNLTQDLDFSTTQGVPAVEHMHTKSFSRPGRQSSNHFQTSLDAISTNVLEVYPDLKSKDLVVIGQIVAEQAVTAINSIAAELATSGPGANDLVDVFDLTLQDLDAAFDLISLTPSLCDIASLALVRESMQMQRPPTNQVSTGPTPQGRHPPRPPPRIDTNVLGPDILPLTASFVRIQRNERSWEMAPTALDFWEALGLSPVNGPKDVRHFCLAPDNPALVEPVIEFLFNLKAAYEGCKFGSMAVNTETSRVFLEDEICSLHSVSLGSSTPPSLLVTMQAYWNACSTLGKGMATVAFDDPGRTLVVTMINPFSSPSNAERAKIGQHFSACFLNLSKSYHTAASRDNRFDGTNVSQRQLSDIDFKIVPIELVASPSSLVVPSAMHMRLLARELYDRCPPASDVENESSPLSNAAAPSIELVAPIPKRIGFQLTPDPPSDLLHEASVLHVAYAISTDEKWLNVVWFDNTGRYANSSALCMQGRSFADVAIEVWQRTAELIKAREVIWRIFIVTVGGGGVERSRANCWKDIISQHTERKQLLSVTMLHFQPTVALSITSPVDHQPGPGSGAPTPAATPQPASGQGFSTTSPDAYTTGNAPATAPPTPVPSEAASSILDTDPEAHLVDTEDETWGMLIDRDVAAILCPSRDWHKSATKSIEHAEALSHGVLIKRGKTGPTIGESLIESPYTCAGSSLIWTLRVRPRSDRPGVGERPNVDEGSARHAEVMLREVLGMFRNLGLLSKVRGLDLSGLIPVHIITAMKGADGLNGLLGEHMHNDED